MSDSLLLPARERLLRFINEHNKSYNLLPDEISFGLPQVITSPADRNTRLQITAAPAGRFIRQRTILYNRLDLDEVFDDGFSLVAQGNPANTLALLPLIVAQFDVTLTAEDVINETIVPGSATYILKAHANSLGWLGEVEITLGQEEQSNYFLLDNHQLFLLDNGAYLILD